MKKWVTFPVVIMLVIGLFIGAEQLGLFQKIADSPTYGWIINDQTNPYLTHEERIEGWGYDARTEEHWGDYQNKFMVETDGRLKPLTTLSPEEMKIQEEQGCTACHE